MLTLKFQNSALARKRLGIIVEEEEEEEGGGIVVVVVLM
jgi:hypothetical protein